MFYWAGKTSIRILALLSAMLIIFWWRSFSTIDSLELNWSHISPQAVRLMSREGGLHLDYTTLRPLSTLRRATRCRWVVEFDADYPPEIRQATSMAWFKSTQTYQVRVALQDLYEDDARTRPIYQSQTVPMKIVTVPYWFVVIVTASLPAFFLIKRLKSRFGRARPPLAHSLQSVGQTFLSVLGCGNPQSKAGRTPSHPSLTRWLFHHRAIACALLTFLIALLWLRSGWREDLLGIHFAGDDYTLRCTAGQVVIGSHVQYYEDRLEPRQLSWTISRNVGYRDHDWIVAPLEFKRPFSIALPFWFLGMFTTSCAVAGFLKAKVAPVYPPGHCAQCGYDLRASAVRCPECGLEKGASITRKPRAGLLRTGVPLFAGCIFTLLGIMLLVGWARSENHIVGLAHVTRRTSVYLGVKEGNLIAHRDALVFPRQRKQLIELPVWIFPVGCFISAAMCLWIAKRGKEMIKPSPDITA